MALRRSFAAGLASIVVAAAMAGAIPGNAVADTGGTPTEVATLPAPRTVTGVDQPLVAGVTGFLHQQLGLQGYLWTDYATGADTVQTHMAGVRLGNLHIMSAGGDFLAYQSGTTLTVGNPATGVWVDYALPQSGGVAAAVGAVGVNGTRALVRENDGVHLLQLNADGTFTEVPITGLPADAGYSTYFTGYSDPGDLVAIRSVGSVNGTALPIRFSLVHLDTGQASPVSATVPSGAGRVQVSGGHLIWLDANGFNALKLDDVLAGTAATPQTIPATAVSGTVIDFAVVGQQMVLLTAATTTAPRILWSVPLAGGPAVQIDPWVQTLPYGALGPRVPYILAQGAGGILVTGGDANSQAVQRLTAAADGSVAVTQVRKLLPPAQPTSALTMVAGQVTQLLALPQWQTPTNFLKATTPLAGPTAGLGKTASGWVIDPSGQPLAAGPCAADATCAREVDGGNQYGPVYTVATGTSTEFLDGGAPLTFPSADARALDADNSLVVINSAGTQYTWEPNFYDGLKKVGPASAAALWMGTLWRVSGAGQIQAVTPTPSGTTAAPVVRRTVSTGDSCTPDEIQVAQHWLYWTCSGTGQAGVYDLSTNAEFTVDAGPALLGDGYLVRHDAASGELRLTDMHSDSVGATSVLATLPEAAGSSDDRHISWTVDRQSGAVAYAGADNVVHVLTTGVPASAVTAVTGVSNGIAQPGGLWNVGFLASRPLADWKLVIRRTSTGQVVYSYDGGPTAATGSTGWNAILQAETPVLDGSYTWQLVTTPADAPTGPASVTATGTVQVTDARMPFHSYGSDGRSTLLAVLKPGSSGYSTGRTYTGSGSGGYNSMAANTQWRLGAGSGRLNAVVPFGDMTGEGYNDLIVRTGSGVLEYYPNTVGGDLYNNTTPVVIGGGWNIYTKLVSVGDLNGDGHDDLLARDIAGRLWLYPGTGRGFFAHRVYLGGGWNAYTQIVGVGDVNGDGNGDLLAVDGVGSLWRYFGNGKGSFSSRVRIGSGFQRYTALVAQGDMNGHGLNSFVARDTAGVLWRYDFTATGTLNAGVRLSSGWNSFIGLY